jgi:hypothetical protein
MSEMERKNRKAETRAAAIRRVAAAVVVGLQALSR